MQLYLSANALHVEDYTESTIEDTFYPHDKKYNFTKKDCKIETFHIVEDKDKIQEFLSNGYQQSLLPKSADTTKYKTESGKRNELKWDTVVKRWKT
ncbi:hypothetical protein P7H06_24170 [Paenibacillus larvae]|nr:hypothetical protein [Paenibacillus larvae]MDT2261968.1 hypothetical protein [Paenibacillus larvae]